MTIDSVLPSLIADRNGGVFARRIDKRAKPVRRLGLPVRLADDRGSERGIAEPARTCRRFCRLATSASTALGLRRLRQGASVVVTKSLVSRIALCVSARDSPARLQNVMDGVDDEPDANSEAKMRLSRLRREIERHIRPSPFRASPLILPGRAVNAGLEWGRVPSFRGSAIGGFRRSFSRCGFSSSTTIRSSSRDAGRFWKRSRTSRSSRRRTARPASPPFSTSKPDVAVIDINLPGLFRARAPAPDPRARAGGAAHHLQHERRSDRRRARDRGRRQGLYRQERRSGAVRRRDQDRGERRPLSAPGDGAADRLSARRPEPGRDRRT